MMHWMFLPLARYATFQGRSTRREFWLFRLFIYGTSFAMLVIASLASDNLVESGTYW